MVRGYVSHTSRAHHHVAGAPVGRTFDPTASDDDAVTLWGVLTAWETVYVPYQEAIEARRAGAGLHSLVHSRRVEHTPLSGMLVSYIDLT